MVSAEPSGVTYLHDEDQKILVPEVLSHDDRSRHEIHVWLCGHLVNEL